MLWLVTAAVPDEGRDVVQRDTGQDVGSGPECCPLRNVGLELLRYREGTRSWSGRSRRCFSKATHVSRCITVNSSSDKFDCPSSFKREKRGDFARFYFMRKVNAGAFRWASGL